MKEWIFITGGCGYIGSHLAAQLKELTNYSVMLVDRRAKELSHVQPYCDIFADEDFVSDVMVNAIKDYKPKAIVHLAADSTIGPSMVNPYSTWENNVVKTVRMLDVCKSSGVDNIIFASSSAVYADQDGAVSENSPLNPISPYATTKMVGEIALNDWYLAHGIKSVSFRFFNVAGAHPKYELGSLYGSSHLLSKIMDSALNNTTLTVFGNDWPTEDGTAIRDYTHVLDITDAIIKAIDWIPYNPGAHTMNLGSGKGYSVESMINTTEMLLGKTIPYKYGTRRNGDSAIRYSNNDLAKELIGWVPSRNIKDIILDSYKWYNSMTYKSLTNSNIHYI